MKTLYLDCGMGAAGDMLTAALLDLLPDKESFIAELNSLGIPGVMFSNTITAKCGIRGSHITVKVNGVEEAEQLRSYEHEHRCLHEHAHEHVPHHHHEHEHDHEHLYAYEHVHDHEHPHSHEHAHDGEHMHHHSGMHEIGHVVETLPVSEKVKSDIMAVYALIADAESRAHGVPVSEIHFHEVGTMDAIADITAVCLLMERLAPEQVVVSPVHVGCGHVRCAHGILPVPAPATALLLRNVPIYGGRIQGELCTPTGAALLKYFAARFGEMPVMRVSDIGYGMGKKDFAEANCVRALIGNTEDSCIVAAAPCYHFNEMAAFA